MVFPRDPNHNEHTIRKPEWPPLATPRPSGRAQSRSEIPSAPDSDGTPGERGVLTVSGLAVLIADNYAVEAVPGTPCAGACAALPLHEHCLFKLGVHLGELWYLSALAAWLKENGRTRFLLTAPPLRLPGAVGSPATPVATV